MTKQIASKIFYGAFILVFVIFVGICIVGIINDKKEEEKRVTAYEQMITEGSKTLLTNEILDEDYERYVQDAEKSKKTFIMLGACFVAMTVIFVLMMICTTIIRAMEEGGGMGMTITVVTFVIAVFAITSFMVIAINFIVPKMKYVHPEKEAYYFDTLNIKDVRKYEEQVVTGSGENRETRTVVHYILIKSDGEEIETSKILYERYTGPGDYYAGTSVRGNIFSLYPDKYFELPK